MSNLIGTELPAEIQQFFDGTELAGKIGVGFLLVTVDADGAPRPCMLSAGEVLVPGPREIRVALWAGTSTAANLRRGSAVLFCFVTGRTVLYVAGRPRPLAQEAPEDLKCFAVEVREVRDDLHPGMPVTSGITFEVELERDEVLTGWERQLAALRRAGA